MCHYGTVCTYHLRVNVLSRLVDPLEGQSDHATALGGSGLHTRGKRDKKTREEQREGETELHIE